MCAAVQMVNADGSLTIESTVDDAVFFQQPTSWDCTWDGSQNVKSVAKKVGTLKYGEKMQVRVKTAMGQDSIYVDYLPTKSQMRSWNDNKAYDICESFL